MANRYLLPVYKILYGRNFSYSDFDQRMEMQKAVYLLQDMGVPIGDYGFRWYLHDVIHSEDGKAYSVSNWVECLASLHYLHENLLSFDASEEDVVHELEKRKPHLDDHSTNISAYRLVEGLFS